eukprot:m.19963 g.19963  ORF g.19963 m.19963 type:complete len:344 (-) comp12355_c0_seq1:68-1099(-)
MDVFLILREPFCGEVALGSFVRATGVVDRQVTSTAEGAKSLRLFLDVSSFEQLDTRKAAPSDNSELPSFEELQDELVVPQTQLFANETPQPSPLLSHQLSSQVATSAVLAGTYNNVRLAMLLSLMGCHLRQRTSILLVSNDEPQVHKLLTTMADIAPYTETHRSANGTWGTATPFKNSCMLEAGSLSRCSDGVFTLPFLASLKPATKLKLAHTMESGQITILVPPRLQSEATNVLGEHSFPLTATVWAHSRMHDRAKKERNTRGSDEGDWPAVKDLTALPPVLVDQFNLVFVVDDPCSAEDELACQFALEGYCACVKHLAPRLPDFGFDDHVAEVSNKDNKPM